MAALMHFSFRRKVLLLCLVFSSFIFCTSSSSLVHHSQEELESKSEFLVSHSRRLLLGLDVEKILTKPKKKSDNILSTTSTKNQTIKLIKPKTSSTKKNQTKNSTITTKIITSLSIKRGQPKILMKATTNSTKLATLLSKTVQLGKKKLNSTSSQLQKLKSASSLLKKLNATSLKTSSSTKNISLSSTKKTKSDLTKTKLSSPKNKTNKPILIKQKTVDLVKDSTTKKQNKNQKPTIAPTTTTTTTTTEPPPTTKTKSKKQKPLDQEDEQEDLINEFRDLPSKVHQTLLPDLEKISVTSQKYINKANKEMTRGFKPYVGNKYAPTIASIVSFGFIIIPLLLVSLIFNKIKAHFSVQTILIFIQVYLSIYFSILCLSSLATGLEPLRIFYETSRSTYMCLMLLQTLGYVLYMILLWMHLVQVLSTDCGLGSKVLGLAQAAVGFAVGLHYYVAVCHRVVLHQAPRSNWKVQGVYATCFFVVCLYATVAESRKKAYLENDGEEGKKN